MGQIEDLKLFVHIIEKGGIAKAAQELNIAKSAVSRRLGQMEERYGVRLINRTPRVWEVTSAGLELYQRGTRIVSDADDLDADFLQPSFGLDGALSISIAREFGLSFLKPTIFKFMKEHPKIDLTIDFDDRIVDLENENYDLAVRITSDKKIGLSSRRIGTTSHGLFASASYIEKNGVPECFSELKKHPLLHYGSSRRARWEFMIDGKKRAIEFQPALNSNSGPFLLDVALQGEGIIRLPEFVVAKELQSNKLVSILPNLELAELGIYILYPATRRVNHRMRAFMDALEIGCGCL